MFNKNKKGVAKKNSNPSSSGGTNIIIGGTQIHGDINASSDIRIDGTLEGNLNCSARLLLGQKGSIRGNLKSEKAIVEGHVEGDLEVAASLHLKESATIEGDIYTDKLIVDAGAKINGTCNMGADQRKGQNDKSKQGSSQQEGKESPGTGPQLKKQAS